MRESVNLVALWALLLVYSYPADAQQPKRIPRIGYLTVASLSDLSENLAAFRRGLRERGYVEGNNIVVEWRSSEGNEVARVILRPSWFASRWISSHCHPAARDRPFKPRKRRSRFPIVMCNENDPVGNGFVASLAHPGGNITGLSRLAPKLAGKQLKLLKETVPRLSQVAIFGTSTAPGNAQALKEIELAAGGFGLKIQYLNVLSPKDFETAFRAAGKGRAKAILTLVPGHSSILTEERLCNSR